MNRMDESSTNSQRKPLPVDYQLHDHDVFCGRGNECLNHVGNIRFRQIVLSNLKRYNDSQQKLEKSSILHEIVNYIRSTSPGAGFVTKNIENGRFYEVGDRYAREKTSQAFRDVIHGKFKSSRKRKIQNPMIHGNINSEIQQFQHQQDYSQLVVSDLCNDVNSTALHLSQEVAIKQDWDTTGALMNESNSFLKVSDSMRNHIEDFESYTEETSHVRLCSTTNTTTPATIDWDQKAATTEVLKTSSTNTKTSTRTADGDEEQFNNAIVRTSSPSHVVDARTFDLLLEFTENGRLR